MSSIRVRLLVSLLALLALAAAAMAAITYRNVLGETEALFDYQLQQMALSLRDQGEIASEQADTLADAQLDFVIQIWTVDGRSIYASRPHASLPARALLGLATLNVDGRAWRTYGVATRDRVIQVAQPVEIRQRLAAHAAWRGVLLFGADGWICAGYLFVWQIVLFRSLGESFTALGGAMAIAALAGAVAGMILGRNIDAGHGGKAVWLAFAALALTTLARATSVGPAMAIIANALGALVYCLYVPTMMTAVYNEAKQSPCSLRFHVATEGAWDTGCASGCFVAAGLIALGVPLSFAILLSLGGALSTLVLLRRYYAELHLRETAAT